MNNPRTRRILFFALLLAGVLAAFRPGIPAKMTADAQMLIYGNPLVTEPGGILRAFKGDFCGGCNTDMRINVSTGFYRPLVNAVFWLEYRFAGTNDAAYNFDQMLFHWACAVMVFFFASQLLPDKPLAPYMAAALFALHPANAYAATRDVRSDLLCLIFYLGAIIAYLRAFPPAAPPDRRLMALSLGCFLGALMSKEMGVTLPAVLVMLHLRGRYAEGRPLREALYTIPFWLVFAAYMAMRSLLLPPSAASPYLTVYPAAALYINAVKNFAVYLLRYILPLGADYPTLLPKMINFMDPAFSDPGIYLSFALLLLITAAALLNIRRHPTAAFLASFMLIAMSPLVAVTHIMDVPDVNVLSAPERMMYIPSVPLLLLAALFLHRLYDRIPKDRAKPGAALATAGAALFLGYQSNVHTAAINSEMAELKSLYLLPQDRLTPRMQLKRECLYVKLAALPLHKYEEAKKRLFAVLEKNPAVPMPYVVLGKLYMETGEWDQLPPLLTQWNNLTEEDILNTLHDNPTIWNDYLGTYHNFPFMLGMAAARRGEGREAVGLFCSALGRGFSRQQVMDELRLNYLLNGPPQCRNAKDKETCMKSAPAPDLAGWRQPLDASGCEGWKKFF